MSDYPELDGIRLIDAKITHEELKPLAELRFGDMVKAVVDIEKHIMALGGELHADEESVLLEHGSSQENLWGINLYVDKSRMEMIEFDSMINIRPRQGNRSRGVENMDIQKKIIEVVDELIAM